MMLSLHTRVRLPHEKCYHHCEIAYNDIRALGFGQSFAPDLGDAGYGSKEIPYLFSCNCCATTKRVFATFSFPNATERRKSYSCLQRI